jgi:[protein-PII] uridylyltransferase
MTAMGLQRGALLADETLRGRAWCRAYTASVDAWLAGLFDAAVGPDSAGVALVAIGGYGRCELCPRSDVDVMFVCLDESVGRLAEQIWYPAWDEALHLGHSVCTPSQALDLASHDLHTATALLAARHVAGDPAVTTIVANGALSQWRRRHRRWLTDLGISVAAHHEQSGDVAFSLEPDLKGGRGGLRDVHALGWAQLARPLLGPGDKQALGDAYEVMLAARVELQRLTDRPSNVLTLQDQDQVALALGCGDADDLMHTLSRAARTVSWTSDDAWRRIKTTLRGPLGRIGRRRVRIASDIQIVDGELRVDAGAVATDPVLVLHAAHAAATHRAALDRRTLERFAAHVGPVSEPWAGALRQSFVGLLLSGRPAIPVIESLDQRGIWERFLPEWTAVRARPQRNPYHRFTVDRHLLETAANAARLASSVERADLLVTSALLHDLGKAGHGDHTSAGVRLAERISVRMGWEDADRATITELVRHHLLLADVATRRDLDDDTVIARVADAVATSERLHLLAALTEADSLATGPAAWGPWKAELVGILVDRVGHVLDEDGHAPSRHDRFPTAAQLRRLAEGGRIVDASGDLLTVMCDDRRGTFSRVAGVLALHGLDVISAAAHSTEGGRALSEFRVAHAPPIERNGWSPVVHDLNLALDGRLALSARLAERAATYGRQQRHAAAFQSPLVTFDNEASIDATVIDVHTPDGVGVLYRITRALAELDLDIRTAKAETRGPTVADAFYVRDADGMKVADPAVLGEIARAIVHGITP